MLHLFYKNCNYLQTASKGNQLNHALFFEEFCTLTEQLVVSPGNLHVLIVGDFNYHMDNVSNLGTVKFNKILESFSLVQHVNGPTHKKGHMHKETASVQTNGN